MMKATRTALIAAAVLTLGIPAAHAGVHFSIGIGVPFPVAPVAVAPVAVPPPPAYYAQPYYPPPYFYGAYYYGPRFWRPFPYYAAYPYWRGPRFAHYGRPYWGGAWRGHGRRW